MTAAASVPLVAAIGLGVDYTRIAAVKSELQRAADAAALAGARVMVGWPPNDAQVTADARMYFWANFRTGFADASVVGGNPTVSIAAPERDSVSITVQADVPTMFGGLLRASTVRTHASSTAQRYARGMELVMALDTTNSMGTGGRLSNLKQGANDLLDIVFGTPNNDRHDRICRTADGSTSCDTEYTILVGIVPFVATVNITPERGRTGSTMPLIVQPSAVSAKNWGSSNSWKGCVMARPYPYEEAQADALPSASPFLPYIWEPTPESVTWGGQTYAGPNYWRKASEGPGRAATTENWPSSGVLSTKRTFNRTSVGWGNGQNAGPNRGCGYPILPLQPFKDVAKSRINSLQVGAKNGTTATLGLSWGWRLLSPDWRSFWEGGSWMHFPQSSSFQTTSTPMSVPHNYDTSKFDKVLVLFTDGQNEMGTGRPLDSVQACCTSAYGDWATQPLGATPIAELNNRTVEVCNAIKARGIKVIVVLLYNNPPPDVVSTFNEHGCASGSDYFFLSANGSDLRRIFREIGSLLSNLRLVH